MEGSDAVTDDLSWLSLSEVALRLEVPVGRVHQLRRDRQLLAFRDADGVLRIPAEFLDGPVIVKHLPGVLTVLTDGGYTDQEALDWLYAADDSLPGTPIQALHENRATEVKRRAQASAL